MGSKGFLGAPNPLGLLCLGPGEAGGRRNPHRGCAGARAPGHIRTSSLVAWGCQAREPLLAACPWQPGPHRFALLAVGWPSFLEGSPRGESSLFVTKMSPKCLGAYCCQLSSASQIELLLVCCSTGKKLPFFFSMHFVLNIICWTSSTCWLRDMWAGGRGCASMAPALLRGLQTSGGLEQPLGPQTWVGKGRCSG